MATTLIGYIDFLVSLQKIRGNGKSKNVRRTGG